VRKATISDYMNKKNALSSDTFEAILNVFAKKKRANESRGGGSANRFSFRAWRSHIYT
jgi:hypothetical protein